MSDAQIQTRNTQVGDGIEAVLSRLMAGPRIGSGLASASRSTTTSTAAQSPAGANSVTAVLAISAAGAAGGLTLSIQGQDPSGNWLTFAQDISARSAAFVAALQVSRFPIQQGSASIPGNPAINGRSWDINGFTALRATVSHSTGDAYTYSVTLVFS